MESYIPISFLNDFIFCPRSIYFHQLYGAWHQQMYQQQVQVAGKAAHETIESASYSTRKDVLQGIEVYCRQYNIGGKIDLFECSTGRLRERKREVKTIYDGYVFQCYAQYFALTEMGYQVNSIAIYDITHNTNYPIALPHQNLPMLEKFERLVAAIGEFDLNDERFTVNPSKCARCIYQYLCDYSIC